MKCEYCGKELFKIYHCSVKIVCEGFVVNGAYAGEPIFHTCSEDNIFDMEEK